MGPNEIRKLRINQLLLANVMMLIILILFFTLSSLFTITFYQFFFTIGVIILLQTIYGFVKRDSTKSIIPLLEKVSIYEKQKMGSEWLKSRRANTGWSIVLSGLMFVQGYMSLGYEDNVFYFEPILMLILTCLLLLVSNISMLFHFRKVDRSTSESELKGYTWRYNVIAVVIGVVLAFVISIITIYVVIS